MQLDLTGVDPKTANRIMKGVEASKRERIERAAPQLLSVLEEFVEDVRRVYIGEQADEMLKRSALAHNWPDLCITYRKAKKAILAARGGQ